MVEERVRWTGYNLNEVMKFTGESFRCSINTDPWIPGKPRVCMSVYIMIDNERIKVNIGECIVKDKDGSFKIVRKD